MREARCVEVRNGNRRAPQSFGALEAGSRAGTSERGCGSRRAFAQGASLKLSITASMAARLRSKPVATVQAMS